MIRIRRDDFDDSGDLARLAATAHVHLDEFRSEFGALIDDEPPHLVLGAQEAPGGREEPKRAGARS